MLVPGLSATDNGTCGRRNHRDGSDTDGKDEESTPSIHTLRRPSHSHESSLGPRGALSPRSQPVHSACQVPEVPGCPGVFHGDLVVQIAEIEVVVVAGHLDLDRAVHRRHLGDDLHVVG